MTDHYHRLGISRDASIAAIKKAYRRQAKLMHPDNFPGADENGRKQANQAFSELTQAYECLMDAARRSEYDDFLNRTGQSTSKPPPPKEERKDAQEPTTTEEAEDVEADGWYPDAPTPDLQVSVEAQYWWYGSVAAKVTVQAFSAAWPTDLTLNLVRKPLRHREYDLGAPAIELDVESWEWTMIGTWSPLVDDGDTLVATVTDPWRQSVSQTVVFEAPEGLETRRLKVPDGPRTGSARRHTQAQAPKPRPTPDPTKEAFASVATRLELPSS